jgi:hypothetical protein
VTGAGLRRALDLLAFPALAITMVTLTIVEALRRRELALDFRNVTPAIRGLAHGTNPYVIENVGAGGHFLWTVLAGWMLAPFAWLPHGDVLVVALEVAGVVAVPILLGVREWRLVALALAWPATVNSVQSGNITVLITVLLAASWHDRQRGRCGLWAGLAVAVKLFAWPVLVWLAATKRWRAFAVALGVQACALAMTLPYISLRTYIHFEATVDRIMAPQSITLDALTRDLGGSANTGRAVALGVGLALLWFGRKELGLVVVAMLVLSPVVWLHYFGLLVIPLALYSRSRLLWTVPILLFVVPGEGNGATWQTACALFVAGAVSGAAWFLRERRPPIRGTTAPPASLAPADP